MESYILDVYRNGEWIIGAAEFYDYDLAVLWIEHCAKEGEQWRMQEQTKH